MNKETMRKHYETTPKDILINILISSREEVEKLQSRNKERKQEIERLNNIIKEALILTENTRFEEQYASDEILLPILNKLRESGIRNYIKAEGNK